jgi:hypothetical protein
VSSSPTSQNFLQFQLSKIVYKPEQGVELHARAVGLPVEQQERTLTDERLNEGFRHIVNQRGGDDQAIQETLIQIAQAFKVEKWLLEAKPNGEMSITSL